MLRSPALNSHLHPHVKPNLKPAQPSPNNVTRPDIPPHILTDLSPNNLSPVSAPFAAPNAGSIQAPNRSAFAGTHHPSPDSALRAGDVS